MAFAAMLLSACAPKVQHGVGLPLAAGVRTADLHVELPEVFSRETGDDYRQQNRQWADFTASELRSALQGRNISNHASAALAVQARAYIAYEKTVIRTDEGRRAHAGFVEVQIRLLDRDSGNTVYSTFSKAKIDPAPTAGWFGWPPDRDQLIRIVLREAVADFVSRL
jgi:hypothetical protein